MDISLLVTPEDLAKVPVGHLPVAYVQDGRLARFGWMPDPRVAFCEAYNAESPNVKAYPVSSAMRLATAN